ncbi:uncharacterized protein LOC108950294 [Ciona intestinalis]
MKIAITSQIIGLCIYWILMLVNGCSESRERETQSLEVRANTAETIVYAQAMRIYPMANSGGKVSERVYTTEFRLICPLKNVYNIVHALEEQALHRREGNDDLYFNVTRMGFNSGWCLKVEAIIGKAYFIFIRPLEVAEENGKKPQMFVPDLVNMQSPIINDTEEHRIRLERFISDGECPLPHMTGEDRNKDLSMPRQRHVGEEETSEHGDQPPPSEHSQEHEYIEHIEEEGNSERNETTTVAPTGEEAKTGKRELNTTGRPDSNPRILNLPTQIAVTLPDPVSSLNSVETTTSGCVPRRHKLTMWFAFFALLLYIVA